MVGDDSGTEASSPARLYATLVGAALVVTGIIGFFYEASFATGVPGIEFDEEYGILAVNGWNNSLHIVLGLLGLAAAGTTQASRTFCLGAGALFVVLAFWGFLETEEGFGVILDLLPVNTEDNFVHLVLGAAGIWAGLATPTGRARRSRTAAKTG